MSWISDTFQTILKSEAIKFVTGKDVSISDRNKKHSVFYDTGSNSIHINKRDSHVANNQCFSQWGDNYNYDNQNDWGCQQFGFNNQASSPGPGLFDTFLGLISSLFGLGNNNNNNNMIAFGGNNGSMPGWNAQDDKDLFSGDIHQPFVNPFKGQNTIIINNGGNAIINGATNLYMQRGGIGFDFFS